MSCSGAGALRLLALLSSASAIVLRPREGCARADGVASEFCAGPLATHPLTAVAVAPALSSSECEHFISASEASALAGAGWRSVLRYDTKEVPLAEIPALQEWFERYGEARLLARIRETHLPQGVRSGALKLRLRDSNVVKYTNAPNGSRAVRPHSDGEDVCAGSSTPAACLPN
ncbi:hypothetical protein T492DRAFT_882285 [Pavlovales sp. CCMP2436]|nr:hypothetical protein T492DRAFT_882285 [Pavlovales sp. CCMP2436]